MNVLLIHRYFAPDTPPYAGMLKLIAQHLDASGHEVTVLTTQPSYGASGTIAQQPWDTVEDNVRIKRVWMFPESKKNFLARGINLLLFMFRVFLHIVSRRRYSTVMAATTPPIFISSAASIAAKLVGAKFIYHCQDIHPELTRHSGMIKEGLFYRFLRSVDLRTVLRAARVVVLSDDMRRSLQARTGQPLDHVRVINNFIGHQESVDEQSQESYRSEKFRILFAGNLGYFQGLETVVDAAFKVDNPDIEFVFVGDGAAMKHLIERSGSLLDQKIFFWGRKSQTVAEQIISQSDICLIALGAGIITTAYPSKTITYMSKGRALLVVAEPDSELSQMVLEQGIGAVAQPGDADALASAIEALYRQREQLPAMQKRSAELAQELFAMDQIMPKWTRLYAELETQEHR